MQHKNKIKLLTLVLATFIDVNAYGDTIYCTIQGKDKVVYYGSGKNIPGFTFQPIQNSTCCMEVQREHKSKYYSMPYMPKGYKVYLGPGIEPFPIGSGASYTFDNTTRWLYGEKSGEDQSDVISGFKTIRIHVNSDCLYTWKKK